MFRVFRVFFTFFSCGIPFSVEWLVLSYKFRSFLCFLILTLFLFPPSPFPPPGPPLPLHRLLQASERLLNDNSLVHALFVGRTSGGGGAADLVAQLIVRPESGATATDATKKLLAKAAALVRQGTTIKLEKNSDNNYNIYVRIHNVDPYTYFFFGMPCSVLRSL